MRISRRETIFIKDTKRKYGEIAWRARTGGLPLRIHDNITGMDVVFELDTSEEEQSSADEADMGVPVEKKVHRRPCTCEKCMQARMAKTLVANYEVMRENAGLPPLDDPKVVTEQQFADICESQEEFMAFKYVKPGRNAIAAYVREMLTTLGLEYKGGRK